MSECGRGSERVEGKEEEEREASRQEGKKRRGECEQGTAINTSPSQAQVAATVA